MPLWDAWATRSRGLNPTQTPDLWPHHGDLRRGFGPPGSVTFVWDFVNPAAGVSLPRVQEPEKRFLSHRQVHELADACGDDYRLVVLFLAYTGLRWGEMAALRVHRVDFLRRRVLVAESVTPVNGVMTFGPTKGHQRREVPLPRFLIDDLAQQVAGKSRGALVFTGVRGAVMRSGTFRRGDE